MFNNEIKYAGHIYKHGSDNIISSILIFFRLIQEEKQVTEQRAEDLESRVGSVEHMNLLLQQTGSALTPGQASNQQQTPSSSTYLSSGHPTITTASQLSTVQSGGLPSSTSIRPGSSASSGPPPQPPPRSARPLNSVPASPGGLMGTSPFPTTDGMYHQGSSLGHHPGSISPPLSGRSTPKAHPVHVPNVIPPSQRADPSGMGAPYMQKYHTVIIFSFNLLPLIISIYYYN